MKTNPKITKRHDKYRHLKAILASYGSLAVAFSGGVDSTLLLHAAHEALGNRVLAVIAVSPAFPKRETDEAAAFCTKRNIRQVTVHFHDDLTETFRLNRPDRCYHCKKAMFHHILQAAGANQITCVAEGSNMDDLDDTRPGRKALKELGIRSPLLEAGLYKEEIRLLAREMGLPAWNKPSFACLATRFPYGESITEEKLHLIDLAEQCLRNLSLSQVRVRIHGEIARIELLPEEFSILFKQKNRHTVTTTFRQLGFTYITLDLDGYRAGSMNETPTDDLSD